jgi:hypothetical protein
MSLEQDITTIKTILEAQPIFKPASSKHIARRQAEHRKKLAEQDIIPVDAQAVALDEKYWKIVSDLENRLNELQTIHNVNKCECSYERLNAAGEDDEVTDIPGDNGYLDRRCLRCGGWRDPN